MTASEPRSLELETSQRCEHCGGDPAGVVVVKRVVTVTYEQHRGDCPTLTELAR
jgi:hypothetical protein